MSEDEKGLEEKVRRRAFELWEQDGMPEGRDQEFWHRATEELSGQHAPDGAGVKGSDADVPPIGETPELASDKTPG